MATEDYKSDSNCNLLLSFDSSPFGSVNELSDIDQEPLTYTYESIQPYHFVLHLCDTSNNEENWRINGGNSDYKTLCLFHKIFSTLSKTKIHHFSDNYLFCQQRLSNLANTKIEKLSFGKG